MRSVHQPADTRADASKTIVGNQTVDDKPVQSRGKSLH